MLLCSWLCFSGLEPEIQKLIAKHKQEVRRLRDLHEAELLQREEQAAQRYLRQAEELRENAEREKEALGQQERERARQRWVALCGDLSLRLRPTALLNHVGSRNGAGAVVQSSGPASLSKSVGSMGLCANHPPPTGVVRDSSERQIGFVALSDVLTFTGAPKPPTLGQVAL